VKKGDLVRIQGMETLGLILSPPKKRYMIGVAAEVLVEGRIRYVLEDKLVPLEEEKNK
tara:strand:- start:684 stop:857 length:174 start_codon:yes stop_codon:yes gene_type:complete